MCKKYMATVRYIGRDVPEEIAFPLLLQRLTSRARVTARGCWEWPGFVLPSGYCETSAWGRSWRVHRLMFMISKGPIPDGMDVLHSCDNGICFNPSHLSLGTDKDNIRDSIAKGRRNTKRGPIGFHRRGADRTHCIRGHAFDAANTYITPDGRRQCRACHHAAVRRWTYKPTSLDASEKP